MSTVIKVDNISKLYQLGDIGSGSVTGDLKKWWASIRGKEDPFAKLAETNDRSAKGSSDYVWALKDISFDVQQGDVLGIIGKNGAGKSTLLKILSKTTLPTRGEIKIKGRVASLLEVGTGFHPDLSGRDNIFLNGAILGMTKKEIRSKFDEIVDFSGVERYIDTPVKRYSSGMYVRLAFAVAAHLEPEILIVDEVLAVGDFEFQKKCLGKIKDVSGLGRTVLFVSHNISAVKTLCTKGVMLEKGQVKEFGDLDKIIPLYFSTEQKTNIWERTKSTQSYDGRDFRINTISAKSMNGSLITDFNISDEIKIEIETEVLQDNAYVGFSLVASDSEGTCLFGSLNNSEKNYYGKKMSKGMYTSTCILNGNMFNNIDLNFSLIVFGAQWTDSYVIENAIRLKGIDDGVLKADYHGNFGGFMRPKLDWNTKKV
jgi:lipopolysaccharide transport system ATP-binding protein